MDEVRDKSLDVRAMMAGQTPDQLQHGQIIQGEDGVKGIVIDKDQAIRNQVEPPQVKDIEKYLEGMDARIATEKARAEGIYREPQTATTEADLVKQMNPNSMDTKEIEKVRAAFADLEPSANGLAPRGSREAEEYARKKAALDNGSVVLPTEINQVQRPVSTVPQTMNQPAQVDVIDAIPDDQPIQFNVPAGKTNTFITTLSKDDRSKIQKTSTIIINEVKDLKIPTATRKIESIDEYRRVRPKTIKEETVECVLPNSGYVAYFKGCGALAMAALLPDNERAAVDYAKRYQFIYDNLVTTSIGKLSYQEFCARTSSRDLEICLFNILRASDPDEGTITLTCGVADCKSEYDVQYSLSRLMDTKSITPAMVEEIEKIVAAKDIYDNAKAVQSESPVMTEKYVQLQYPDETLYIVLKSADGIMMAERNNALMTQIAKRYSPFIIGFLLYVPKMVLECVIDGETESSTYEITDPQVIVERLGQLTNEEIKAVGTAIEGLKEFDSPTFSFKGDFKCPKCGHHESEIDCTIDSLIFFKVGSAIR